LHLKLIQSYRSIVDFPPIDLPKFTVITGTNGSGKTHLLEAIKSGAVSTGLVPEMDAGLNYHIRLLNWTTMVPDDIKPTREQRLNYRKNLLLSDYENAHGHPNWLDPVREVIKNLNLGVEYIRDPLSVRKLSDMELAQLLGKIDIDAESSALQEVLQLSRDNFLRAINEPNRSQIVAIAKQLGKDVLDITGNDIRSMAQYGWGNADLFQPSYGHLFMDYRDLLLENELAELRASKGKDALFLSKDEFIETYKPAPWDIINDILADAGMDFRITKPEEDSFSEFQPMLHKVSTGVDIPFSSLSSGEKILMSLVNALFYSSDGRQTVHRPTILLLDEIDAPLHPSMVKTVINTIQNTFVKKLGIHVIATTHSPSTVALSPDDSIYAMHSGGTGLKKVTKADALNILTGGVPRLAISYGERRQVFVESPKDAELYRRVYEIIRPNISSDIDLEFITTGTSTENGDQNTGCENVKRLVDILSATENISVFGLLDSDKGKHQSSGRIEVLAEGSRDGLENVLLDPLLIGIAICRRFPDKNSQIGLQQSDTYASLIAEKADKAKLQALVDSVSKKIFGSEPINRVLSRYGDALELYIDERCCSTDDHEYENSIISAFNFLVKIKNNRYTIMDYVVDNVLRDAPYLMPRHIREVIEKLLLKPAHCEPSHLPSTSVLRN
jgi:energy-coupling factor transporter ATP-binding protein EcfA2